MRSALPEADHRPEIAFNDQITNRIHHPRAKVRLLRPQKLDRHFPSIVSLLDGLDKIRLARGTISTNSAIFVPSMEQADVKSVSLPAIHRAIRVFDLLAHSRRGLTGFGNQPEPWSSQKLHASNSENTRARALCSEKCPDRKVLFRD